MTKPLVSIIVPNYNHAKFLKQRLDSVFNQTVQGFEVILLDDASTDDSVSILEAYKDHPKVSHLICNVINSGSPFKQWQKGINLAKGDFIWIAESDDYCELNFLETLLLLLEPHIGVYYAQTKDVDEKNKEVYNRINYTKVFKPNIWETNFWLKGKDFVAKYFLVKNVMPNASAVIFKRGLLHPQVFNDNLMQMRMCGDWLFWVKLCKQTNIKFCSTTLNYFRHHKASSRNHKTKAIRKQRLIEEKILRAYVLEDLGVSNTDLDKKMYMKWFELHTKIDIFKADFYNIKLPQTHAFKLLFEFVKFKLMRK